jgi:hypothetical protein
MLTRNAVDEPFGPGNQVCRSWAVSQPFLEDSHSCDAARDLVSLKRDIDRFVGLDIEFVVSDEPAAGVGSHVERLRPPGDLDPDSHRSTRAGHGVESGQGHTVGLRNGKRVTVLRRRDDADG